MERLIKKYLRGELSAEEHKELARVFAHYGYRLDEDLQDLVPVAQPDTATVARMKSEILRRLKPFRRRMVDIRIAAAVAATLLVGIFGALALRSDNNPGKLEQLVWHTKSNSGGGVVRLTMPDSSHIWLNAKSTIRYPSDYNETTRTIQLHGEAFFEVKPAVDRPFRVFADSVEIKALGTSFVVENYVESPYSTVSVVSGLVRSSVAARNATTRELPVGTRYRWHRSTGEIAVDDIAPEEAKAWLTGTLVFKEKQLAEIALVLERRYGVTFQFAHAHLKARTLTLKVPNEPLQNVLDVLHTVAGIDYRITDNVVYID